MTINTGYGAFYYGRGVYGKTSAQIGNVVTDASWNSTAFATRIPLVQMTPSNWATSSTYVAHPMEAGQVISQATSTSSRTGHLVAGGKYSPVSHWTSSAKGVSASDGALVSDWTIYDDIRGNVRAVFRYGASWTETSEASGRFLWEKTNDPSDPNWTPVIVGSQIWTPIYR